MQHQFIESDFPNFISEDNIVESRWKISSEKFFSKGFVMCRAVIIRGDKSSFFHHYFPFLKYNPNQYDENLIHEKCGNLQSAILIKGIHAATFGQDPAYFEKLSCTTKKFDVSYEQFFVNYNHQSGEVYIGSDDGSGEKHVSDEKFIAKEKITFPQEQIKQESYQLDEVHNNIINYAKDGEFSTALKLYNEYIVTEKSHNTKLREMLGTLYWDFVKKGRKVSSRKEIESYLKMLCDDRNKFPDSNKIIVEESIDGLKKKIQSLESLTRQSFFITTQDSSAKNDKPNDEKTWISWSYRYRGG